MLPIDSEILCNDNYVQISDLSEEQSITSASGWGETYSCNINDIFVNFDQPGTILKLTTSSGAVLRCSPEQMCFGRMNPLLRNYSLYLHERSTLGFRIGATNDLMRDILTMTSLKPSLFNQGDIVDKIWIIQSTPSLLKTSYVEKLTVYKYGLPDIKFTQSTKESSLSEEMIRELFNAIDTPSRAHQLLRDQSMFYDFPHITMRLSDKSNPTSNAIQFVIFGSTEKKSDGQHSHLIQIDGSVEPSNSEHKIFKRRQGKHGLWYLEVSRSDLEEAELFVKTLSHLDNLEIIKKIQLSRKPPFYILPASHLKTGMLVPILTRTNQIEDDTIASVEAQYYDGPLYNLQIKNAHNFIAGKWVLMCYNSPTIL